MSPTEIEIAWAAGIYEGEGNVVVPTRTNRSLVAVVTQKDPWILRKLHMLFSGHVSSFTTDGKTYHRWRACGNDGRNFLLAIYHFLSPRRKEQVMKALVGRTDYVKGPYKSARKDMPVEE